MNAIQGGLETIKKFSPIIIIEFSKFIFDKKDNLDYLNNFLTNFNYKIYDTNKNVIEVDEIINKINQLTKRHKTIGNFYLIKNSSKQLELFKKDD
jgi:dihydroorotase